MNVQLHERQSNVKQSLNVHRRLSLSFLSHTALLSSTDCHVLQLTVCSCFKRL